MTALTRVISVLPTLFVRVVSYVRVLASRDWGLLNDGWLKFVGCLADLVLLTANYLLN